MEHIWKWLSAQSKQNNPQHFCEERNGKIFFSFHSLPGALTLEWGADESHKVNKRPRFSANDASQLQQEFGHSRAPSVTKKTQKKTQQDQTVVDMNYVTFKSKEKMKKQKTPNCCENEFILLVIKYRSPIGCLHGSVFDYCLWFQSNVIYCLEKHLNKTAPRHSSAREAWRASPLSRLCWLAELQQMCINIVIKLKKKKKKVCCSGIHHCPDRLQEFPNKICLSANRFLTFIVM